eukprot:g2615.t1
MATANKRVCFVCTGNTCRSFMAEFVAKDLRKASDNIILCSRGTSLRETVPHPTAITALQKTGCKIPEAELKSHKPTALGGEANFIFAPTSPAHLLQDPACDLTYYFCMTRQHRESLMSVLGPAAFGPNVKVFLLADNSDDIPDPYNGPLSDYEECLETLRKWCGVVVPNLASGKEPFDP